MNETRILQISNDISEDDCDATKKELVEVVKFWQRRCDDWNDLHQERMGELLGIILSHHLKPHP